MGQKFLIRTQHITYDSVEEKETHKIIMLEDGWNIDCENDLYIMWKK